MGNSSKGATTSQSSSQPPPEVMEEYRKIMDRANTVSNEPYQQYSGQLLAPFSPDQLQAFQTVAGAQGIAQPYFDTAKGYAEAGAAPITASQIQQYYNPYQQKVVNATLSNLNLLNQQQQTGLEGNLAGSGGLFNDRFGVAQAQLAGQQATSEAPTIAGLEASGFQTALAGAQADRAAMGQAAYTFGNLGTANLQDILSGASAELGTGGQQQQQAQQALNIPYMQWQQSRAYPYQQVSWLAGIDTGVGSNMGGTSTTTTTPPKPWYQFWNRGGGIKPREDYQEGGGIGSLAPYSGGNLSYIPGIQITHGHGPPAPAGATKGKAQDPFGDIMKMGDVTGLSKKGGSMFSPTTQGGIPDMMGTTGGGLDEATLAGSEAGLSPEELGFTAGGTDLLASGAGAAGAADAGAAGAGAAAGGMDLSALFALFALARGGGINLRRGFAEGGDTYDDDNPPPDPGDGATTVPSDTPPAGLGPLGAIGSAAPLSSPSGGLPASMASSDPTGLAARPSRAPTWPGEEAPAEPELPRLAPSRAKLNPVAQSPVAVEDRGKALAPGLQPVTSDNYSQWVERSKRAIGTFESGNNYGAIGQMTHLGHALGRYQVMEKELPEQLRAAGLPPMSSQEFLNNPAAQDKVFETVFGGYMKKYGNFNDAASMWFSGRPAALSGGRRDVLGTTVPQYLANTNAILARDDGSNPLYGPGAGGGTARAGAGAGAGDRGLRLSTSSDGEGNVTSETQKPGLAARLFTPENALRFGLAMLANPTPYVGQAIGQAGLATLGATTEAERYGAKQAQEERKFQLDASTKQAQIKRWDAMIAATDERQKAQSARDAERVKRDQDLAANMQEMRKQAAEAEERRQRAEERAANKAPEGFEWVTDENGKPVTDPTTGGKKMRPTIGGPKDPEYIARTAGAKKTAAGEDLLDDVTLKRTAAQYNLIGGSALTNLGRGAQSAAILKQVRTEAAHQDEEAGITPEQRVQIQAQTLGQRAAQRTLSTQEARMGSAAFEAEGAMRLARPIIAKVDASRTGFLPFNKLIVGYKNNTLDPDQRELAGRLQAIVNTYGAVMARGANVVTDSARHRGEELLDSAFNAESLNRILDTMQSEIDMAKDSPERMRQFYMQKYGKASVEGGGGVPGTGVVGGGGTTPPAGTSRPPGTRIRQGGHIFESQPDGTMKDMGPG